MKKLITLVAVLALTLAFSVPAFAANDETYSEEAFSEEVSSEDTYSDYDYSFKSFCSIPDEWLDEWVAANPELVAEILKDDPPVWAFFGYDSQGEFMCSFGFDTEEEYFDFVLNVYASDYYLAYKEAEKIKSTRLSMGGTEEGLAVMFNGSYIAFPSAQPEYAEGRAAVPFRAFIEALGGQVGYEQTSKTVTAALNAIQISFAVGSDTLSVAKNGETLTVPMYTASYNKNGTVYLPVRSIAEVLGYDVSWDLTYETVVLLDRAALIGGIDKDFTVINKLFKINRFDQTKTYQEIMKILVSYTQFSTLDGNKTTDMSITVDALVGGMNQEMTVTMDLKQLLSLLGDAGYLEDIDELTLAMLNGLTEVSVDVIFNLDEGTIYIRSDIFALIGLDKDTWLKTGGIDYASLTGGYGTTPAMEEMSAMMSSGNGTIGTLLYLLCAGSPDVFTYGALTQTADMMAVVSDNMFTKSGDTYTLNIGLENSADFLAALNGEDYSEETAADFTGSFKEFNFTLKITDSNGKVSASGSFVMRENPDRSYSDDVRFSGTFSLAAERVTMKVEIHQNNVMMLTINIDAAITESTEVIASTPPEGSVIVDVEDVLGY